MVDAKPLNDSLVQPDSTVVVTACNTEKKPEPWEKLRFTALMACLCVGCSANFAMYLPVTLEPDIQEYMKISPTQYNLLFTLSGFCNIFLLTCLGTLTVYLGRGTVMVSLLIINVIGQCLAVVGVYHTIRSYGLLLTGQTMMNIAASSTYMACITYESVWFKGKETAVAMSIDYATGAFVVIVTFFTQPVIFDRTGKLETCFIINLIISVFSLSGGFVLTYLDRSAPDTVHRKLKSEEDLKREQDAYGHFSCKLFGQLGKAFWLLALSYLLMVGGIGLLCNIICAFLHERFGIDTETSGYIAGSAPLIMLITAVPTGYFLHTYGHKVHAMLASMSLAIVFLVILMLIPDCKGCYTSVPCYFGICLCLVTFMSSVFPSYSYVLPERLVGLGLSLGLSGSSGTIAILSPVYGRIIENTRKYQSGYLGVQMVTTALIFFAIIPMIFLFLWDKKHGNRLRLPESEETASQAGT